jgi:hypothetical protein
MYSKANAWVVAFDMSAQINPAISQYKEQFLDLIQNAAQEHFYEPEYIDAYIFENLEALVGVNAPNIARTYESIAKTPDLSRSRDA